MHTGPDAGSGADSLPTRRTPLRRQATVLASLIVAGVAAIALGGSAAAQDDDTRFDNEVCLGCHAVANLEVPLPSGEVLNAVVDRDTFAASVHGELGLPCVLCHTAIEGFPHPELQAETVRDVSLDLYTACFGCHQEQYTATLDNVHGTALGNGNVEAAVCTDCHGAHDVQRPTHRDLDIALTCRDCHSQVFDLYADSVHGEGVISGSEDVPTCTDCHGVHDAAGPSNSPFHLFSPQLCAECHADEELMGRYGISTDVFDTYVADFHGTTVVLFEELAPDQETNKPVCIDCHGVHNIVATDDPDSTVFRENLLGTCQRCHPDATTNFPAAWLSHYQPTAAETPLVFGVRLFYRILIPLVIGAMLLYVVIDGLRRLRGRRRVDHVQHG